MDCCTRTDTRTRVRVHKNVGPIREGYRAGEWPGKQFFITGRLRRVLSAVIYHGLESSHVLFVDLCNH